MSYADATTDFPSFGLAARVTVAIGTSVVQRHLDAASAWIDSCLTARVMLPLVAPYPVDLVQKTCEIASYTLLAGPIGFNPDNKSDKAAKEKYEDARAYFDDVREMRRTPPWITGPLAAVSSDPPRGFYTSRGTIS